MHALPELCNFMCVHEIWRCNPQGRVDHFVVTDFITRRFTVVRDIISIVII